MGKPFHELRERLLLAGVAPRYVRRYLSELSDHLSDLRAEEEIAGLSPANAESAALTRLGTMDELAAALIEQRHFQSWSVRAPWAVFGIAPLFLLAAAYLIACSILWSGWRLFLPGAVTPFVRIDGLEILYFGVGKLVYIGAPVFIGWGIGVIAARQRLKALWPTLGLVPIALISVLAQVHASGPVASGGVGQISMGFSLGASLQGIFFTLANALEILSLMVLPYLIWRVKKAHRHSA